jgi:hypothetical protein
MTTVSNTMLQMIPYNQQIVELKKCNSSYQISLEMILFNSYLFYLLLNCKRHLFELSLDVEKSF